MKKRTLAYIGIVGGLVVLTLSFYTVSQFVKTKLNASQTELNGAESELTSMLDEDPNCLTDTNSIYHDRAMWFKDIYDYFKPIVENDTVSYSVTATTSYVLSILTLVSFGLVLKDADKQKEKEDK